MYGPQGPGQELNPRNLRHLQVCQEFLDLALDLLPCIFIPPVRLMVISRL